MVATLARDQAPNLQRGSLSGCRMERTKKGFQNVDKEIDAIDAQLNDWREAGKDVGRKLGVLQERRRILFLIERMIEDGDFVKTNGKRSLEILTERIGSEL
jgi:hypothetical protein